VRLSRFHFYGGSPDTGAVYRQLRCLENNGYIISQWETGEAGPARRTYSITPDGIILLQAWADEFKERKTAIEDFLRKFREFTQRSLQQLNNKTCYK
jgi:DNA-binding PadR family transcriptional regulator